MDAVKACTKMFQSAAQSVDVALEVAADKSLDDLAIDYVSVDASRIDQIIINLLTNAVCPFTEHSAHDPTQVLRITNHLYLVLDQIYPERSYQKDHSGIGRL